MINEHEKSIYRSGELWEKATIRDFRMVRTEGNRWISGQITGYDAARLVPASVTGQVDGHATAHTKGAAHAC